MQRTSVACALTGLLAACLLVATATPVQAAVGDRAADARQSTLVVSDYDGPGGIDGPGEVLCNALPGEMPVLKFHTSNHPFTKLLQAVLHGVRVRPGPVDGVFGSMTRAAVRRFQTAQGLTVDGWVGRQTWRALQKAYC